MNKSKQGSITVNKLGIVTIVSIGLIGAVSFVGDTPQESLNKSIEIVKRAEDPVKTIAVESPAEATEDKKVDEVVDQPTSIQKPFTEPPTEPQVLSSQAYAEKYLNLSALNDFMVGQECFDAIVAAFPERFLPEVREDNVKSLAVFAYNSPCGTGYGVRGETHNNFAKISFDRNYPNGTFFDKF